MKIRLLILAIATLAITFQAKATSITIDLGPSRIMEKGPDPANIQRLFSATFADLNGLHLTGQSVQLDIAFREDQFIRIFTASPGFSINLAFTTNAGTFPGFLGVASTGSLLDQNANEFGGGALGRAASSDGRIFGGLFPGTLSDGASNGLMDGGPYDAYGIRFDLVLPNNPGVQITSSQFAFYTESLLSAFGIGPNIPADIVQLPDSGTTWSLFAVSLVGLALFRRRFAA